MASTNANSIVPAYNDVLCGSGKAVMNHPGNQAFRSLVKASVQNYADSHSFMKAQIKETIVLEIEAKGGRFLKKIPDGSWCILSHAEAVDKTSQALRDAKRLVRDKLEEPPTPVKSQSLEDGPMQSMTMSPSLVEPSITLSGPVSFGINGSTTKLGESLNDSVDVAMLSSMLSLMKTSDYMAEDDGAMMPPPPPRVNNGTPNSLDVLCGSGKAVMNHPGNMDFRRMVKTMVSSFSEASGPQKAQISEKIVHSIEFSGGRFLKQNSEGVWHPLSHSEAVEKTSQALRDAKRLTQRQKNTTDTAKADSVESTPYQAFVPSAIPSSMKVHSSNVVEGITAGDLSMLSSFGPGLDDPSSVVTFEISGKMESIQSLDNVNEKGFWNYGYGL